MNVSQGETDLIMAMAQLKRAAPVEFEALVKAMDKRVAGHIDRLIENDSGTFQAMQGQTYEARRLRDLLENCVKVVDKLATKPR